MTVDDDEDDVTHFVEVPCRCPDAEHCAMVRYIADVRIAFEEIERLSRLVDLEQVAA